MRGPCATSVLVFALALALRACAARGDFWLDEIWSWMLVRDKVQRVSDIFLTIQHDNNHLLNSLWIYALGLKVDWHWYRVPAVLASSAAVLVMRQLLAASGRVAQWLVTVLCLPSFLLVNYGSEARGYGVMMFCTVASLWLLERLRRSEAEGGVGDTRGWMISFWLITALGVLAHGTFGACLVTLTVWQAWACLRSARARRARCLRLAWVFGPPWLWAIAIWALSFRHATVGGGPLMGAAQAAAAAASLTVGGPASGPWVWPLALLVAVALVAEIICLARARDDRAVLWGAMLLVPAVPLAAGVHAQFVYPRFFLTVVEFAMLALASLGARGWRRGGTTRLLVGGALALVTVGNLVGLAALLRDGRGHPAAAVRWIADHSRSSPIVAASDQAFRHGMTLSFYSGLLHHEQRLVLLSEAPWPAQGPEWILRQDSARDWRPAASLHDDAGRTYGLEALYPCAGLSGFTLALYHRDDGRAAR